MADAVYTGFPKQGVVTTGFPSMGFPSMTKENALVSGKQKQETNEPKEGTAPKNVKYYEGKSKLNKTNTAEAWKEFGGERLATYEKDGSAYITRIIERESKKTGVYFKLEERLTKQVDGYGVIEWRIDLGSVVRRKPAKQKFDTSWTDSILVKVEEVVIGKSSVQFAAKDLANELGVSFSTIRANLWVADKWAKGEFTTFLPHRSMIVSIYELLCKLEKKENTLKSMLAYSKAVKRPSEYVLNILRENGRVS